MSSWRDTILDEFAPNVSMLTLVDDPDHLLTEGKLALELRKRGFDMIEFSDPIEFRYAYESRYRSTWDEGKHTDLVIVPRGRRVESLPYDLLQAGRKLSFSLGRLFPNLSYPVIEKLDKSLLDSLYEACSRQPHNRIGDNATMDFILSNVFKILPDLITNEADLLQALLRLHYQNLHLPLALAERLARILLQREVFKEWPLPEIVSSSQAFFAFLQERWPLFLSKFDGVNTADTDLAQETPAKSSLKYSGPTYLPFGHKDVKVYIDDLFLEGKLAPVEATGIKLEAESWIQSGIISSAPDNAKLRITHLFDLTQNKVPDEEALHNDWITFALKWAELSSLVHCGQNADDKVHLENTREHIDKIFASWLESHYSSLISLSPANPAMLHHVPRHLAREMENSSEGLAALIVVDGLALDQWVTIRQILQKQSPSLVMSESATFAWIPTITSVSRQSIFSGKQPMYFQASINTTSSEEKLWRQFWENQGMSPLDVSYQLGLGDGDPSEALDSKINLGRTKVIGLVVDKVDKIMHGMQLGSAGMHNQIKQWCQGGFLAGLLDQLLESGYAVWLTSDHGNLECAGRGRPSEGSLADKRGERMRMYTAQELRAQAAKKLPFAREWHSPGLPESYFPLIASGRGAFVRQGETIVAHGGASIEEVIVPLVKISRRAS